MARHEEGIATNFALVGELAKPEAELLEELEPTARPWEELLHVLGRFSSLAYLWSVTFHRRARAEEGYESVFAERVRCGGQDAVVFHSAPCLHVLVPPDRAEDAALVQRAVAYGAYRIQALGRDSFSTLMPFSLADAVRAVPGIYPSESHFHSFLWMSLRQR